MRTTLHGDLSLYSRCSCIRVAFCVLRCSQQVWRQLWRVCELCDLLILSADARHPMFHFPPSLYRYVVEKHNKPFVLVLNKVNGTVCGAGTSQQHHECVLPL